MYIKSIFVLLGIRNPYAFNKYYIKIFNNHTTLIQRSSENTLKALYVFFWLIDRGVNAIVYMVDAADSDKIEAARNELHNLLEKPQLAGIPVLVLGMRSCILTILTCRVSDPYSFDTDPDPDPAL
jgi:hypothetical protein